MEVSSEKEKKSFKEVPLEDLDDGCDIPLLAEPPTKEGLKDYNKYLLEEAKIVLDSAEAFCINRTYNLVVKDLFEAHAYINETDAMAKANRFTLSLLQNLIVKYKKAANDSIGFEQEPATIFNK